MIELPLATLHPWSSRALGGELAARLAGPLSTVLSAAWPSANRAYFVPFAIESDLVVKYLWLMNGSAVSGNFDIGIYSEDGTKLCSTGSTVQAGTSAIQIVTITAYRLSAGQFYLALGVSNTTGQVASDTASSAEQLRSWGVFAQDAAVALPATATPATVADAYLPLFGLGTKWMV